MQIVALGMDGRQVSVKVEPGIAFHALRVEIAMAIGLEIDAGLDLLLGTRVLPLSSQLGLEELGVVDGVSLTVVKRPSPRLLTAALDGTARLWNSMTGECLRTFIAGPPRVERCKAVFSSDGTLVLTVADNMVKIFNVSTGECMVRFGGGNKNGPPRCAFSRLTIPQCSQL